MDQSAPNNIQTKPMSSKKRLSFNNISDENINEIKPLDDPSKIEEKVNTDEDEAEYDQDMPKKKKKGFFDRLFSWCGKKREIIRAKTMKYGARLTKRREEPAVDKSTISLAAAMTMCKKDEKIVINENI